MTKDAIAYLVFGCILVLALLFDLGLLSKKGKKISIRTALYQTFFWVFLALAFFVFMWLSSGRELALQYISGYLMEWSLSIDNIFVFIVIFTSFAVKEKYYGRVLLIGILMAILFRVIFITVGVALVDRFEQIMYVFGAFLIYTGYRMFTTTDDEEFEPHDTKVYRWMKKLLPLANHDGNGKMRVIENGKRVFTSLFVVVIMLAFIDLLFALDSIPAIMGLSQDKMVIYTSNVFAVLGLRSLFFLLRGAVTKFDFLQQGIAIVLVFIGLKMLLQKPIDGWIQNKTAQVVISLAVIIACITGSILFSIYKNKKTSSAGRPELNSPES
jgi:tellurite resistance protein TerC